MMSVTQKDATKFSQMNLIDVRLITPERREDGRGYFCETYVQSRFSAAGITAYFVQDNESVSAACTVRGLHYQAPPNAQAKLIRVVRGAIYDVALDLRTGSPTFGKWTSVTLSSARGEQLFVPRGFAHGFCTLEPDTHVIYKVDAYYSKDDEGGIVWNDPDLAIPWPVSAAQAVVSGKDKQLPRLRDVVSPFRYSDPQPG
jgi:dTDP-4-dehydrorhamnose 3,5-epimerase